MEKQFERSDELKTKILVIVSSQPFGLFDLYSEFRVLIGGIDKIPRIADAIRLAELKHAESFLIKKVKAEYLNQLQVRYDWLERIRVSEGQIMMFKVEDLPSNRWLLGKIVKLHLGRDEESRLLLFRYSLVESLVLLPSFAFCLSMTVKVPWVPNEHTFSATYSFT